MVSRFAALLQRFAGLRTDDECVSAVHCAVDVQVVAVIVRIRRVARAAARLLRIARVHDAVAVRIALIFWLAYALLRKLAGAERPM